MGYSAKPKDKNKDDLFHDELIKTSLGSEKDLNIQRIYTPEELINFSREKNLKIIVIEQQDKSLKLKQITKDIVEDSIIVFGNETDGISEETLKIADHTIEIERLGNHNSLNVTTTAGIVLYKIAEITN
jgi:23S rRNA (guanosine2251-2'-O)-methyltransferase